ncbi:unnamed protein product [Dicrocoelium dendriticum]|nr:unnamed protein product [Dicrocoelium dendriticum]
MTPVLWKCSLSIFSNQTHAPHCAHSSVEAHSNVDWSTLTLLCNLLFSCGQDTSSLSSNCSSCCSCSTRVFLLFQRPIITSSSIEITFGYPVGLFSAFLCFLWLVYLWETYLDYRQYMTVKNTHHPPPELSEWIDNAEFQRSRAYTQDKSIFSFTHDLYDVIETTLILYFSVIPWLWSKVTQDSIAINSFIKWSLGIDLGINSDSEIICSLVFLFYVTIYKFFQSLPWSLYFNFVIEARHGFNNQTLYFFFKDRIKATLLSIAIGFPLSSALIWIIKFGGRHFYIYAYIFALVVTLLMMFVYPEFIAPLFDRYAPLPDGSLRNKIEALAARINFPLKKLLVVEGSKRSAHSNAYFYGFGKNKRIVLYDTLMRGFKFPETGTSSPQIHSDEQDKVPIRGCALDEEVVAVLGHELGHWKYGHTIVHLLVNDRR